MTVIKNILKLTAYLFLVPIIYLIVSLIISFITVDRVVENENLEKKIFLNTNGVHLDIIIPTKDIDDKLIYGIMYNKNDVFLSFGWGDENFYLNTPTWSDLTFSNVFIAMFLNSSSLMHVSRHRYINPNWIEIKVSSLEFKKINEYILNSFELTSSGKKLLLKNRGYSKNDDFYQSKGSYSFINTCNSWVNKAFKESGLKSCLWTPFDFTLLNKYE